MRVCGTGDEGRKGEGGLLLSDVWSGGSFEGNYEPSYVHLHSPLLASARCVRVAKGGCQRSWLYIQHSTVGMTFMICPRRMEMYLRSLLSCPFFWKLAVGRLS